jgi:hypothetical protein
VATIRSLITEWGFSIDDRPLRRVDARVANLKASLSNLSAFSSRLAIGFGAIGAGLGYLLKEAGDFEQM